MDFSTSLEPKAAKVKAIDKVNRSVTLERLDGSVRKTSVDPSIKAFDTLKAGDARHAGMMIALSLEK